MMCKLKPIIDKEKIYKRLHIDEGTEVYKNAEELYKELFKIILNEMDINAGFIVTNGIEINGLLNSNKYVVCFVTSYDNISQISNEMISEGCYLKGYLLHEMSTDAIFNASNKLNNIINCKVKDRGYTLTKRYAPGDGIIDLNVQQKLLDLLNINIELKVSLNEEQVLIPEKTLLYLYGLTDALDDNKLSCDCVYCNNLNCSYREI